MQGMKSALVTLAVLTAAIAVAVTTASAHIERASYWPDPAPDTSVTPPAGGKVPKARSLFSALRKAPPGRTRVVCQGRKRKAKKSLRLLNASIRRARTSGWTVRPSQPARKLSARKARRLRRFNKRLAKRCKFRSIQAAVFRSRNNDRIVVMPGLYTEKRSRRQPTDDPKCDDLEVKNDEGSSQALSYAYQVKCPNDQNLIAVMGRRVGSGQDPVEPHEDRHGIPNIGPCVRCNLQIEGSGVSPDDVVVDAGRVASGDRNPIGAVKDVGIRADRADGFVLRKMKFRHAAEHNIYVLESDGYRLEYFKTYWAGEYGVLTFVEDHGLMQHCDAAGHGDAGLYPGASAETGEQTVESGQRFNQEVRFCDSHHNAAAWSGTSGNAVWVHHNEFYDNALGLTTDVFTASGHPGFPSDSLLIEHNNFHSNNFNPYQEGSDVEPTVPFPVGTGMWIAGGNNMTVRHNRFWNNWRRGAMLFSVPDAFVCGSGAGGNEQAGCDESKVSTSYRNKFHDNVMGIDPQGRRDPNGTDFWWDEFLNNTNNCWYSNIGRDGTEASITSEPDSLPSDCSTSRGLGNPGQQGELLQCFVAITNDTRDCPWFTTPPEPQ
jgi:Right handed beta helix region